jgi:hypothetical protein
MIISCSTAAQNCSTTMIQIMNNNQIDMLNGNGRLKTTTPIGQQQQLDHSNIRNSCHSSSINGNNNNATDDDECRIGKPIDLSTTNRRRPLLLASQNDENSRPQSIKIDEMHNSSNASSMCCGPGPSCLYLRKAVQQLFPVDDFERVEFLGEGFFSDVYKVCIGIFSCLDKY